MLRRIIHFIAYKRHPWRAMDFNELAEIYTSMSLRSLGFGMIGIFVPVYLYTKGVALQDVFWFLATFFATRIPTSVLAGYLTGRIGPKHTLAVSTVFMIVFLGMLMSFKAYAWPLLLLGLVYSIANSLFFVSYQTDFSKVKHKSHAGKELGWLYFFERAGGMVGPVIGGAVGSLWAPEATLIVACSVFVLSLVPLFMTNEPVKTHTKVQFKGFKPQRYARNFIAIAAFNTQHAAISWVWPLFIAVFIFKTGTYAKVGALVGLTMAISVVCARAYGAFIDSKKGRYVLRYGVFLNFILNFAKATVSGASGVVAASAFGEPVSLSYSMPLSKGLFDEADGDDNHRIVYLTWSEIVAGATKTIFFFVIYIMIHFYDAETVLRTSYFVVPFIGLLMLTQKFKALR